MSIFSFKTVDKIIFGVYSVERVGEEVKELGGKRPLIVTDKGVERAGLVDKVREPLEKAGLGVEVYSEVKPEPPIEVAKAIAEFVRGKSYDLIVGLGGGSSMDISKLASMMATNPGSVEEYIGLNKFQRRGLPMILIPTTSGTGSEVSWSCVVTIEEGYKETVKDTRYMGADVALVDPLMTLTMPPKVTASSGLDALSHAAEAFISLKANPVSDALALEAIALSAENLRAAYFNGENVEARSNMSLAATLAAMAFTNSMLGLTHTIAEVLGPFYEVPHGIACGITLPYDLKFNLMSAPHRFVSIAEAMGEQIEGLTLYEGARRAVEAMTRLIVDLDIPKSLRDLGVPKERLGEMAETTLKIGGSLLAAQPRKVSEEDIAKIYEDLWEGQLYR